MIKHFLIGCACLALSQTLIANTSDPVKPNDPPVKTTSDNAALSVEKVFLGDVEERVLYVDFAAVTEHIKELNILRNGKLMMQDDVNDLPDSTIYEVNMEVIRPGTYVVELVTEQDIKIQKEITVQ